MAFKMKIALTVDMWFFFNNIRKIIFLTSISPADWIVQTGAPGSDRGSDLFSCGAISPTAAMPPKLLWYLQHFHCNVSDIFYLFVTLVWSLKIWVGLSYPFWACEIFTIKEVPQHFSIVAWSLNSSVRCGLVFQVFICTRNYAFGSQQHLQLWSAERFGKIRMDDDQSSASQLRRSRLVFYQWVQCGQE